MTLPHILRLSKTFSKSPTPSDLSVEEQRDQFTIDAATGHSFAPDEPPTFSKMAKLFKEGHLVETGTDELTPDGEALKAMYGPSLGFPGSDTATTYSKAIEVIVYWIELIRSSVLSYAPNPAVGPPIIRLTFGILYQNIATIASKYSISIDEMAGYDVPSLLPNKINISITLQEIKESGNVEWRSGLQLHQDQIRGWESVVGRGPVRFGYEHR